MFYLICKWSKPSVKIPRGPCLLYNEIMLWTIPESDVGSQGSHERDSNEVKVRDWSHVCHSSLLIETTTQRSQWIIDQANQSIKQTSKESSKRASKHACRQEKQASKQSSQSSKAFRQAGTHAIEQSCKQKSTSVGHMVSRLQCCSR